MSQAESNDLLLLQAIRFAAERHRNQRRKDAEASPYINHPIMVSVLLVEVGDVRDPEILAAATLHDTIEDTRTTPAELEEAFGARVRGMVEEVTDDKKLPKQERKRRQIEHAKSLSAGAALIKLGDKISNVLDVANSPPTGWALERRREYLDWAEAVVNNCPKVNPALEQYFAKVLGECRQKLAVQTARQIP